ncbi:MAG: hypothetical protein RLZZ298_2413 [Pseudomonadota bacterium]|jgi:hypothetical protein
MPFMNLSDPKQNAWYPRHVSDRVDELIDELDAAQCELLYDELGKETIGDWFVWIEEQREAISGYDGLSRTQRKRRLGKSADTSTLKLHHACVFVELWRARTTSSYFHLPPSGGPLDTEEAQRRMMLAVVASFNDASAIRDLWPFEFPEGIQALPFRDSEK